MNSSHRMPLRQTILVVFFCTIWAQGQPEMLRFEHIGPQQGLSHTTVTSIYQDEDGFVWFGTIDGLNRFDGYRCKVYQHDPHDPVSLSSSFIHGMVGDRTGRIWIATRDGGLSVMTREGRRNGRFLRYEPDPHDPASLSHRTVQTVFEDSDGRLWIGTPGGLDLFDPASDKFIHYRLFAEPAAMAVTSMVEDSKGVLWLATFDGLHALDLKDFETIDPEHAYRATRSFRHDPQKPGSLASNALNALFQDRAGRLWFSARGAGISLLDKETSRFRHFRHDPRDETSLSKNNAIISYEDRDGLLWIGTDGGGLNIMDPRAGRFTHYRHQPSRSQSLSHDNVTAIYQTNDGENGTIWVLTWGGGVNKLIPEDKPFQWLRHDPENPNTPLANFVLALTEDRFGDLWVGTGKGLSRWDRDANLWESYYPNGKPGDLSDDSIWQIYETRAGDLWICTEGGGLNQLIRDHKSDRVFFHQHRHEPRRPDGLQSDNIRFFFEDRGGVYWVGYEERGLSSQSPLQRETGSWTHYRHDARDSRSLSHDAVRCMAQDAQGTIWIGTLHGGLNRLDPESQTPPVFHSYPHRPGDPASLSHNDVRTILIAGDGTVWIGTYGGGLNRFEPESQRFSHFGESDGLANAFVYGLLEDEAGHLWISTNRGLSQFDPTSGMFTNYDTRHGLQSDEFNTGAYHRNRRGEMFFGGVNGFNVFHPGELLERQRRERNFRPKVVLTSFHKMGNPLGVDSAIFENNPIKLEHGDKYFSFELAVLDYHDPAQNRFRYRLEGFDEDWIDNGRRNFASYTNLDPGEYVLRYQGAGHAGGWHEGPPLRLLISPPFWQTWWFRLAMVATLAAAVLTGLKVRQFYRAYRGVKYVGHFKILRKLGAGGSGAVFQARDKIGKRLVALKILHQGMEDTKDGIRRFLQEAEIGSRLRHPHIVTIYEVGSQAQTRFISMEYLDGQTLKDHIRQRGPLEQTEILQLGRQILDGLGAIHREEIVHRDLKSANIMVLPDRAVKIMDFGLARLSALTTMSNREQLMGTLSYMSPEQTLGKVVDPRSDLYAFGVILYEMRFGRLPFLADHEMELIYAIHNEPPPALQLEDGLGSVCLDAVIAKCMEKDPSDRYARVDEILDELVILESGVLRKHANVTGHAS